MLSQNRWNPWDVTDDRMVKKNWRLGSVKAQQKLLGLHGQFHKMPLSCSSTVFCGCGVKKKKRPVLHNLVSHCSVFVYFKFMRVVRKSQATSITSPISRKKDRRSHFVGSRDIMVTPNYTPPSVPTRVVKLSIWEHQWLQLSLGSILYSPWQMVIWAKYSKKKHEKWCDWY